MQPTDNNEVSPETGVNETARRILNLLFILNSAATPLSTEQIISDSDLGYGSDKPESDQRKFRRDREKLEQYGIFVREVKAPGASEAEESAWAIDRQRSHIDTALLTKNDADTLLAAVNEYLKRGDIPYREALLRIRTTLGSLGSASKMEKEDSTTPEREVPSSLEAIWTAYSARKKLKIRYADARGKQTERTVAIYGIVNQLDHCYFVAHDSLKDGIFTFRADRIVRAWKPKGGYSIPDDFDISLYLFLPIDLGKGEGIDVEFTFPATVSEGEVQTITNGREALEKQADGSWIWRTHSVSPTAAARMALTHAERGMRPLAPESLIDEWNSLIEKAVSAHA